MITYKKICKKNVSVIDRHEMLHINLKTTDETNNIVSFCFFFTVVVCTYLMINT